MFCTKCGTNLTQDLKFCTSCGAPVKAPETPRESSPPVPSPAPPSSPAPPAPPRQVTTTPAAPVSVAATPEPTTTAPTSNRKPLVIATIAFLALIVAASVYFFVGRDSGGTPQATTPSAAATSSSQTPAAGPAPAPSEQARPPAGSAPQTSADSPVTVEQLVELAASGDPSRLDDALARVEAQTPLPSGDRLESRRLNDLALPLMKAGNYTEAVPLLEQASRADASDVEVAGNLADALMRVGRMDDAFATAKAALRLAPRRTVGWSTLGLILAKRDEALPATACFLTGYRFSNVQPTTLAVYTRLAASDSDPKVQAALSEAVRLISEKK